MTEPLLPDPDAPLRVTGVDPVGPPTAVPSTFEPPAVDADPESFDFVSTETVALPGAPPATVRRGRGPAVVLGYLAAALAGALLLGGGLVAFGGIGRASPLPSPSPSPTPRPNIVDGPSLGSAAAPVTIEIWADYQCPYCRLETIVFGGSMERTYVLPGFARIVYRDFAFLGQESTDAAVAARCAGRQDPGAYWRYHDLLFASQQGENQGTFARPNLLALAGIAALDATTFSACLDDPAVAKAVADETAQGRAAGIVSTPTLRVIGPGGTRLLAGISSGWSTISDAIAAASTVAPAGSPGPGESPAATASGTPAASP
jgi:protein-disulfide isomerase